MSECSVCLDAFREPWITPCGHTYCKECLDRLVTVRQGQTFRDRVIRCPDCRNEFARSEARPNVALRRHMEETARRPTTAAAPQAIQPLPSAPPRAEAAFAINPDSARHLSPEYEAELLELGATRPLIQHLLEEEQAVALRMFLLDNSGSTAAEDGTLLRLQAPSRLGDGPNAQASGAQFVLEQTSRWEEIKQVARDHARHNLELNHVCEFHLLNPRSQAQRRDEMDYVRLAPEHGVTAGLAALDRMLQGTSPGNATPLAESLDFMNKRIQQYANGLLEADKRMFVVVVTDGVPTPLVWNPVRPQREQLQDATNRMVTELYKIVGRFPASLVVRLCTNDDDVVEYWNELDETEEFALDVVDDMLGEAQELAQKSNTFFTYTPALHRIREGGFTNPVFDCMDEKELSPRQQAGLISALLVMPGDPPLPSHTSPAFNAEVIARASTLPTSWNPRTRVLEKTVDPNRMGSELMSFVVKLIAFFIFAFILKSIMIPSHTSYGSGYPRR